MHMKTTNINFTFLRYSIVGGSSAAIHGIFLILLSQLLPLWISNLLAFLAASISSYLGHALFTFRKETRGSRFAKRWLLIQYLINISISSLLPIYIKFLLPKSIWPIVLILTPTLINCIIWLKAKTHTSKRRNGIGITPILHADDFGLTESTNEAIIHLKKINMLKSTSLIVNGNSIQSAINSWKEFKDFPLSLHLCLTEGPATGDLHKLKNLSNKDGTLSKSFFQLLMISCLPKKNQYRKLIRNELKHEIVSQIQKYKSLTKLEILYIDGHQHIHLIPIVMEILIELKDQFRVKWIRTTSEPIATGISLEKWRMALIKKGVFKWIVLQILSYFANIKIKESYLQTNSAFSGVLFTGMMQEDIIIASSKELAIKSAKDNETAPLILTHPSYPLRSKQEIESLLNFNLSTKFFRSKWRYKEFEAICKVKNSI